MGQMAPPSRSVGYKLGNPAAPLMLEMFADLQCPYCGGSYPVIKQVVDYFGGESIYFVVHIYPLWLHRQAYDADKAMAVIAQNNPNVTWEALAYFFANQGQFFNAVFLNKTEQQLIDLFAGWAAKFGVSNETFVTDFNGESVFNYVDYDLHLGISRQVPGTPVFFINGFVNSTLGNSTTYGEWVSYLGGLINNGK